MTPTFPMNYITGTVALFLLSCAYAAQYWTYKSHQELRKINDKLDRLLQAPPR